MAPKGKKSAWEKLMIAMNKAMNSAFVKKCKTSINNFVGFTYSAGKITGIIAWIAISTALVSVVPLFLELDRESTAIEAEKRQIAKLRQRGYTSQQISSLQAHTSILPQ